MDADGTVRQTKYDMSQIEKEEVIIEDNEDGKNPFTLRMERTTANFNNTSSAALMGKTTEGTDKVADE